MQLDVPLNFMIDHHGMHDFIEVCCPSYCQDFSEHHHDETPKEKPIQNRKPTNYPKQHEEEAGRPPNEKSNEPRDVLNNVFNVLPNGQFGKLREQVIARIDSQQQIQPKKSHIFFLIDNVYLAQGLPHMLHYAMTETSTIHWLLSIIVTLSLLVGFFFYLCFKHQVLAYFGRKALDNESLFCLFILACVPALFTFSLLDAPQRMAWSQAVSFSILFISAMSAKELMAWLARGINTQRVELDNS